MRALTAVMIVGWLAVVVAGQQTPAAKPQVPPSAPKTGQPAPTPAPATPTPPTKAAPAAPQRRTQARPPAASTVTVRDRSGSALAGVKISVSDGSSNQQATTGSDGKATLGMLRDGDYRLRFEREGFITFERESTVRARQPLEIDVWLSAAPAPPEPPAPPPAPAPVAAPPPAFPSSVAAAPTGPPTFVSIPDFLNKNYIGREPLKESVVGCLSDSTTRILQLKEGVSEHTHSDLDEMLYVVAGEGTVRVRTQSSQVTAGSLSVIPHGQPHAITPRGKNPLMLVSILSGSPCRASQTAATRTGSDERDK